MPVNRGPNQTPIGEPNDNLPSVRPTPSSQSGIITRGRAQVERMESDRNLLASQQDHRFQVVHRIPVRK